MSNRTYLDLKSAFETPKKKRKSAAGRRLVRWNPDMDQQVLLHIDAVCAKQGIAIPWDDVAHSVVEYMTGEAIKQHLVKLHRAREEAGLAVPERVDKTARRRALQEVKAGRTPDHDAAINGDEDEDLDEGSNATLLWSGARTSTALSTSRRPSKPPASANGVQLTNRRRISTDDAYTPTRLAQPASKRKPKADDGSDEQQPAEWATPTKRRKSATGRLPTAFPKTHNGKSSGGRGCEHEDVKVPVQTLLARTPDRQSALGQNRVPNCTPITPQQSQNLTLASAGLYTAGSDPDSTHSSPTFWASQGLYAFSSSSTPQPDFHGPAIVPNHPSAAVESFDPAQLSERDKLLVFGSDAAVASLGLMHEAQTLRLKCGVQTPTFDGGVLQSQQKLPKQQAKQQAVALALDTSVIPAAQVNPSAFVAGGDRMMLAQAPTLLPGLEGFANTSPINQMPKACQYNSVDRQTGVLEYSPSSTSATTSDRISSVDCVETQTPGTYDGSDDVRSTMLNELPSTCSEWANTGENHSSLFGNVHHPYAPATGMYWGFDGNMVGLEGSHGSQFYL